MIEPQLGSSLIPSSLREKRYLSDLLPGWLVEMAILAPAINRLVSGALSESDSTATNVRLLLAGAVFLGSLIFAPVIGFLLKIAGSLLLDAAIWRLPFPAWIPNSPSRQFGYSAALKAFLMRQSPFKELPSSSGQSWIIRRMLARFIDVLSPSLEREMLSYYRAGAYLSMNLALAGLCWFVVIVLSFPFEILWGFNNTFRILLLHIVPLFCFIFLFLARYCLEALNARSLEVLLILLSAENSRDDLMTALAKSFHIAEEIH